MIARSSDARPDDVLSLSERSRVFRRYHAGGSAIVKQSFGPDASRRVRHETAILARLAGIEGVARLLNPAADLTLPADALALEDDFGESLSTALSHERLAIDAVLDLALLLTKTVVAMHRRGVVHRDVNPSNILLVGPSRRPILIDFHLASSFAEERPAFTPQAEIAGTLAYIAPEQTGRTGRAMDQRADLYALGATLYEMTTGRTPFESEDAFELIRDHLVRIPASPVALDPDVPHALSEIIMRLLEKEPDRRYQSAEGLLADLTVLHERRARGLTESFPLGQRDFPQRLLPPSRLIGREAEIMTLQAAFAQALDGHGAGLLVAGAPGVGKTALIGELRSIVTARGGSWSVGKFDRYRRDTMSDAVTRALRNLLCLQLAEPEEHVAALRERLSHALGSSAVFEAALLPELALLLGVAPEPMRGDPLTAGERLAELGVRVLRCIASPARPVVFVLDDLQWASNSALAFVEAVLRDAHIPGLLLVGTYRATELDPTHPLAAMLTRWERLSVPPQRLFIENLRAPAMGDLLAEMLRLQPNQATELVEAVGARTRGNPYDTVELLNALRRDGALTPGIDGWTWDETTIRRFVGRGDVVDLLTTRIAALPPQCRGILEIVACLGGDVALDLLQAAAGLSAVELEETLTPALDDGLLVLERGSSRAIAFRHDRVQQAAYAGLAAAARFTLQLAIARRLVAVPRYEAVAAEQFLAGVERISDPDERTRVIALFRSAARGASRMVDYAGAERFLVAAASLVAAAASDDRLARSLQTELHAALYNVGKLEEADAVYRSLEGRHSRPLEMIGSACVQISSLTNRNLPRDAVAVGLDVLRRIGLTPPKAGRVEAALDGRLDAISRWCDDEHARAADFERPATTEPHVIGAGRIISRMMAPAFFCDRLILRWLILESLRLWSEHGPQAALVGPCSLAGHWPISFDGDYRLGYRAARHVLTLSEARHYEPGTSLSRFLFSLGVEHWFESFEDTVRQAQSAREGLLRGGDLQNACYSYAASIPALLECASVAALSAEIESGLAFSARTRNDKFGKTFLAYHQFTKALRGETNSPGSFTDASFDEEEHLASLGSSPTAAAHFRISRALSALLFGQSADLMRHASAAMPLLTLIPGNAPTAIAHAVQALALAQRVRAAPSSERGTILAELDRSRAWLERRAADAPQNFGHCVRLIEAERAWALEDYPAASAAFEAALVQRRPQPGPRHRAFVAERAGRFYLERGLERYGRLLLGDARVLYAAWGATAKARQLDRDFAFSPSDRRQNVRRAVPTTTISSDTIDMVGVLRASQALSSQTSLSALKSQVVELLAGMTGATAVQLVVRGDDSSDWLFWRPGDELSIADGSAADLLPLTAFRYVERTHEALLIADAVRDDRFARDRYFKDCEQCSLLVVPILSQGVPRAILLLENRLSRGAFSANRLDAVMLIAGQLAVSLDNALLYASLERKVAERTEALAAANAQLALLSLTDALTGLVNRRGFDQKLEAEWLRAGRTGTSIGIAMIDVDEFKSYNDRYGHPAGDACLQRVAATLNVGLRPESDLAARYGGEEFVLLLPGTGEAGTYAAAERFRTSVAALHEPHAATALGILTVSIGVVAFVPSPSANATDFLKAADVALYEAKRNGRNQVAVGVLQPTGT